jgi:hypothetical protein
MRPVRERAARIRGSEGSYGATSNDRDRMYSGGETLTWVDPNTEAITLEQTAGTPAVFNTNGRGR